MQVTIIARALFRARSGYRDFFIPQGRDLLAAQADVGAIIDAPRKGTRDIERRNDALIAVIAGSTHSLPPEEPDLQPENPDYQPGNLALQPGKSNSQPGNLINQVRN